MISKLNPHNLRKRRHRSRGGVMVEFALIFPLALVIMLFAVDMGRVVLLSTGLHDATAVAARAGARQGFIGSDTKGPARAAFNEATNVVPGLKGNISSFKVVSPTRVIAGTANRTGIWCTQANLYVKVSARANIGFITPGLGSLLNTFGGGKSDIPGAITIGATGVARCEVAR